MKIKRESLINLYFLLMTFYIFTNYIYSIQSAIIIGLSLFLIAIKIGAREKIKIDIKDVIFILMGVMFFVGCIYSTRSTEAIKFAIPTILMIFSMIIISKEPNIKYDKVFKYIFIFSSIHVACTIIYQLFPSQIQSILPYFLSGENLSRNIYEFNNNRINCGITPIQSINAFYITCFLMIIYTKILKVKEKRILNILFLILGMTALFLTSKRGLLVANIVAMFFVTFYDLYKNKKIDIKSILKIIIVLSVVILVGYFIIVNYIPEALKIFKRFTQEDVTTGRNIIYKIVFDSYKDGNIILGMGLFTTRNILYSYLGTVSDSHNVYLQVLSELGILGIIVFLLSIYITIRSILKVKINSTNNQYIIYVTYFIILFYVYGMTGNGIFDLTISTLYYLMIAILFNLFKYSKEGKYEDRNINIS